jgi:hypothetical protein
MTSTTGNFVVLAYASRRRDPMLSIILEAFQLMGKGVLSMDSRVRGNDGDCERCIRLGGYAGITMPAFTRSAAPTP